MSEEFNVGDVVVCVNNSPILCERRIHTGGWAPEIGTIVRVVSLGSDDCGCVWLRGNNGAGLFARFKKLPKATDEFTRQIRACRPNKSRQPA